MTKLSISAARRLLAGALGLGVLAGVRAARRDLTVLAAEGGTTTAAARVTPVREVDAACERCHAAIFRQYVTTPMANGSGAAEEHFVPGETRHAASGMEYAIDRVAGAPTLHYSRIAGAVGTSAGTAATSAGAASAEGAEPAGTHPLSYFLGSGNLGSTYLYSENGYLLESPVAFYSRLRGYDMAPGLADARAMPPALPMTRGCMRCHMSDVQAPDRGSRDHFAGLPFLHGGITCEQCHGDAGAHVASGGKAAVVNPLKLDAAARDSVCISCHLEGDVSVEHKGRSVMSYKPGDHIADTLTHFVLAHDSTSRSVSETEELEASRCKRASGDRMSCMSCHDPHGDPAPEQRVAFYRAKCLACHGDATFAAAHFPDQPDCTGCHMPKSGATDTPHVAWTDHRLRRRPEANGSGAGLQLSGLDAAGSGAGAGASGLGTSGLGDKLTAPALEPVFAGTAVAPRDHALAAYKILQKGHREFAALAWRELNEAYAADHDDAAVAMALGYMNQQQGRSDAAQRLFADAVRLDPDSSEAANDLATLLAREGKLAEARALWEKTFARNEDMETLGVNLATTDCAMGDREHAVGTLRQVLVYSPAFAPARERLRRIETGQQSCAAP